MKTLKPFIISWIYLLIIYMILILIDDRIYNQATGFFIGGSIGLFLCYFSEILGNYIDKKRNEK